MPQKVIKFTGINRKVDEFQNSGACEELINLRPEVNGGCRVVRQKHVLEQTSRYERVYEHKFGNVNNIIGVRFGIVESYDLESGSSSTITSTFQYNDVQITTAGSILVIYCPNKKDQRVFKYEDGYYKSFDVTSHRIHASIEYRSEKGAEATIVSESGSYNNNTAEDSMDVGYNRALESAVSNFYKKNENGLCGACVVGCTYELEDGSEVWSTGFVVADINKSHLDGYKRPEYKYNGGCVATVYGSNQVRAVLNFDERMDGIKSIKVYASKPVFQFEYLDIQSSTDNNRVVDLESLNLDGQLMYYQGKINPKGKTQGSVVLNFSKEQVGEDLMNVTSGCIDRIGPSVSYNSRFHYYHSDAYHVIQTPTISSGYNPSAEQSNWIAYAYFEEEGWKLINAYYDFSESEKQDFIYPMGGIERLAFVKGAFESGVFSTDYSEMFYVNLQDSSAYNYAFAFDVTPKIENGASFKTTVTNAGQQWGAEFTERVLLRKEGNIINVSIPLNPFAFSINASYSLGGEVLDIATAYMPISATQVGQFPLTVFTSNGIFSLEQGSGNVLYSNVVPLQPHVITGKATTTPWGTFFVSSRNLYLLSGREVANLSYVLNGERELAIRELSAYKNLCFGSGGLYSFESLVSSMDFEDYIQDVSMAYDQLNNELIVSSRDENIHYSYVLNLDTKSFYKVAKKYLDVQNGARYAVETVGSSRSIVDLHLEDKADQSILLQSKPLSLDVFYTHIHRLIMSVDTKLEGKQNLCVSVFGSDNLNDWKCIISAQKQKTVLRHIRTNRAAKSYKDYVILINGTVGTDTDLSDIIMDYTVVSRRLG